jgi:hypothetical protein
MLINLLVTVNLLIIHKYYQRYLHPKSAIRRVQPAMNAGNYFNIKQLMRRI